jgi:hypothetical protein
MSVELSSDQVPGALRLRTELESLGVRYLRVMDGGCGGWRVLAPDEPLWSVVRGLLDGETAEPAEPTKPRHRQANAFEMATIERLDELLAERRAALDAGGAAADGALTLQAIADALSALPPEFKWTHTRVWRAQAVRNLVLEAKGWDLPTLFRSHPEFRADNGLWRLPTLEKAREYWG